MIHVIVDNAAELGFLEGLIGKDLTLVKPMFKNKYNKLQASYELSQAAKKIINDGVDALDLGKEFKV
jgi:hypothetical protein